MNLVQAFLLITSCMLFAACPLLPKAVYHKKPIEAGQRRILGAEVYTLKSVFRGASADVAVILRNTGTKSALYDFEKSYLESRNDTVHPRGLFRIVSNRAHEVWGEPASKDFAVAADSIITIRFHFDGKSKQFRAPYKLHLIDSGFHAVIEMQKFGK